MNSKPFSVKAKLTASFGVLTLAVLVIAIYALHAIASANDRFLAYVEGINARALVADDVRTAVDRRAIAARNMVLATSPADLEAENAAVLQAHAEVQSGLATLTDMVHNGAGTSVRAQELVAEMRRVEQLYGPVALDIVKMANERRLEDASAKINTECRPLLAQLVASSIAYKTYTAGRARALLADAQQLYSVQRNLLMAICAAALAAAVVAGTLITRNLSRALGAEPSFLGLAAQRIAAGDLQPIEGASGAVDGSVLASLGTMQQSLANIVSVVRNASESIANGSSEIAGGNADLSQRTEEQASALQQTAATMEELGTTVRRNADHARQASGRATDASAIAVRSGEVVTRVVTTMKGIHQSSQRITDIIGVIDSIAFQTNILALNAAVEAARAGELGRGFAVVATEVRSLAARSAQAAKEIKTLIAASVGEVEQGNLLVDEAGKTMQEVVSSIHRVSDIVAEISSASAEQSTGVAQVGEAVVSMDRVTQQNAALVEESAAAAASLKQQAQQLLSVVGTFTLDSTAGFIAGSGARHLLPAARSPEQASRLTGRIALAN